MAAADQGENDRLRLERVASDRRESPFAADVRAGLLARPKALPPKYFYDALGSVLFEAICNLPEYYVTRAETQILEAHADELMSAVGSPLYRIVELGSGSSVKTRILITEALRRHQELEYVPIDVSAAALESSAATLLRDFPNLRIRAIESDYEGALDRLAGETAAADEGAPRSLVIFLGSSIGNLDPAGAADLLRHVRRVLAPADAMLLGVDLAKSEDVLVPAYDDPLGVTAAFNLNLLVRINRELGGDFDLGCFRHLALFNAGESRIEMHLESRVAQRVRVRELGIDVDFDEGETIHTENSYKFSPEQIEGMCRSGGFSRARSWLDPQELFSLSLLRPV